MPNWLPSIPYPAPDQPGYWEPVTSTLQWCEEDYYATFYSAEIINTLTNFTFIYLAWKGVRSCNQNGHDTVFKVAYFGYFLVAIGSFMFHSTLKYPWQLVDELNMIYTTCLMCWASLTYARGPIPRWSFGIFFTSLCAGITAYYHYLQDPDFHQNVYAALTIFVITKTCYTQEVELRPKWRHSREEDRIAKVKKGIPTLSKEEQERVNVRDLRILKELWTLVVFGVAVFLSGFALWGIDNQYCSTLRSWRREIGLPWGVLLEGHGWWHILTGWGAYCYIVWGIYLRHALYGNQDDYRLKWNTWLSLPEVVRAERTTGKVTMNGHGKTLANGNGHLVNGNGHLGNGHVKK